jgi:O-antigen/teichoic acid export membrane protein
MSLSALIKKFISQDVVKVFSLTGLSTLVRMLTGFISVKVVAVIIGPTGIALLGQLNNFTGIVMSLASGGINNGIVKYISEYKDLESTKRQYFSTALRITLILSGLSSLTVIIFSKTLAEWVLFDSTYSNVFIVFGLTLSMFTLNGFLLSILNGLKEFTLFVKTSVYSSVFGVIFTVTLVYLFDIMGALISAVTFQSISLFITVLFIRKSNWFTTINFSEKINKRALKNFLHYSLMTFVTALTVPVAQLFIRSHAISNLSVFEAGMWEGMNRISGIYLTIITTSFGIYYLPRLSETKNKRELNKEIVHAAKIILPIMSIVLVLTYLLRHQIVSILFSKDFYPMQDLFAWQLIGDMLKTVCWMIGIVFVAKTYTKLYIVNEVLFSLLYVGMSVLLVDRFGIVGITIAHALNYMFGLVYMTLIYFKYIRF